MAEPILDGVFAVNKPAHVSSAQALRDLQSHFNRSALFAPWLARERERLARESALQKRRRRASKSKVQVKLGHGGTLDPLATGVLIAGVGRGTKQLPRFLGCAKTYEAVVLFGTATDTYDTAGRVVGRKRHAHVTRERVEAALGRFRGTIAQRPPLFSALHMDGKRLYDYAREGAALPREIPTREVEVSELELVEWWDGGTHAWTAPDEEAGREEKAIAAAVLDDEASEQPAGAALKKRKAPPPGEEEEEEGDEPDSDHGDEAPNPDKKKRKVNDPAEEATVEDGRGSSSTAEEDTSTTTTTTADGPPTDAAKGPPAAKLRMTVSSGFYVRSLCHDLGAAVGSLALMAQLVRSRQAGFALGPGRVLEYADLERGEPVWGPKVARFLREWDERVDHGG